MSAPAGDRPRRREHLDWLRGVAVLLMIEAHLFDSWTGVPDRESLVFHVLMLIGGGGTTLFLFLAGVSVALSAGSKLRRTGSVSAAANAVVRRGLEIFALAFLFRAQAWILGWSPRPTDLLKVDILNIMGPSMVLAALLWRVGTSTQGRARILAGATAATAFLTPFVRVLPPAFLPSPILAYLVPVPGLSNFVFFPWTGLVLAGTAAGILIDAAQTPVLDGRVHQRLAIGGALVCMAAVAASLLPTPLPGSYFWTTSPAYLFLRSGLATLGVAGAHAWIQRWRDGPHRSMVLQLGRTSLFIYWIHVELLYGLISRPWHRGLNLMETLVAYLAFCGLMLGCSIAKQRIVGELFRRRMGSAPPPATELNAAPAPRRSPPLGG